MFKEITREQLKPLIGKKIDRSDLKQLLLAEKNNIQIIIDRNIVTFGDKFPAENCINNYYPLTENVEWTTSFWSGQLWLLWQATREKNYRIAAEKLVHSFGVRIVEQIDTNTHDLGFLYTLSCVTAYELTGNLDAKKFAILAAESLLGRFHQKAHIIQAWGDLKDPNESGRMIIDCNMNLPLLYWATRQTGDQRFATAARMHAQQAAKYLVRPDASTFHTYYMDTSSGAPIMGRTQQGFSDDSCWSRGQAWGIYGFMLSFLYTGDTHFIDLSKCLANYFINRLPDDYVCHWDLALLGTNELRDSSAAAIAVCGLLELAKQLPNTDPDREYYEEVALRIMSSLTSGYLTKPEDKCNGLLQHSVYHFASNKGVDECCSWGDYFYVEALVRITQSWYPYWSY